MPFKYSYVIIPVTTVVYIYTFGDGLLLLEYSVAWIMSIAYLAQKETLFWVTVYRQ